MSKKTCTVHHIALKVGNIPYFISFFEDVFGMSVYKKRGEAGAYDSVWLDGGIQLLNTTTENPMAGSMDHISFLVDDVEEIKKRAEKYGAFPCPEKAAHWFQIPEGIVFELKAE